MVFWISFYKIEMQLLQRHRQWNIQVKNISVPNTKYMWYIRVEAFSTIKEQNNMMLLQERKFTEPIQIVIMFFEKDKN